MSNQMVPERRLKQMISTSYQFTPQRPTLLHSLKYEGLHDDTTLNSNQEPHYRTYNSLARVNPSLWTLQRRQHAYVAQTVWM